MTEPNVRPGLRLQSYRPGDALPTLTREMLPHASDVQWAHMQTLHEKRLAHIQATGRDLRTMETVTVLTPEEFNSLLALIQAGDVTEDEPDPNIVAEALESLFGGSTKYGKTTLAAYVRDHLPEGYWANGEDLKWLDECNAYLKGPPTNASVTQAVDEAVQHNPRGHIDPYELLIDGGICDTKGKPFPPADWN